MADPRLERPLWRGRTNVDALTISCIEKAETIGGHKFDITQGSYQSSVTASAGTHDRGGAVDLRWCGHGYCILALRQAGMAAWHRNPEQGPWVDHIHAVVYGHPDLAPAAARQITALLAGRNGLANNGPDDGPQLRPFPKAVWPPEGEDEMAQHTDQLNRIEAAALAAVTAAEKTKARVDKMGANLKADRINDKALAKALRELGVDVDKVLARVMELDDEQA